LTIYEGGIAAVEMVVGDTLVYQ